MKLNVTNPCAASQIKLKLAMIERSICIKIGGRVCGTSEDVH